jgi:hypothetical protein
VGGIEDLIAPDLEWVVTSEGVVLERDGDRLIGNCPLHEDNDPSFALWKREGRDWVGCWACGFGPTDDIGFIMAVRQVDYKTAVLLRRRHAQRQPANWESTALPARDRSRGQFSDFGPEYRATLGTYPGAAYEFLGRRGWLTAEADETIEQFRLSGDDKWIVVPHYTPSGDFVTALKSRTVDGELRTLKEGVLAFLYGCWRDEGQPYVVLAEGESDTWRLTRYWRHRDDTIVLGLPAGAKPPRPSWLSFIGERKLLLLFDGDEAGRRAVGQWKEARECRSVDPGDKRDASKLSDFELDSLL